MQLLRQPKYWLAVAYAAFCAAAFSADPMAGWVFVMLAALLVLLIGLLIRFGASSK